MSQPKLTTYSKFADARLAHMCRRVSMWGSNEAVELQGLTILESEAFHFGMSEGVACTEYRKHLVTYHPETGNRYLHSIMEDPKIFGPAFLKVITATRHSLFGDPMVDIKHFTSNDAKTMKVSHKESVRADSCLKETAREKILAAKLRVILVAEIKTLGLKYSAALLGFCSDEVGDLILEPVWSLTDAFRVADALDHDIVKELLRVPVEHFNNIPPKLNHIDATIVELAQRLNDKNK